MEADEIEYDVDLGAEKLIAATKDSKKILVEIKSFLQQSKTYEMHKALGQFNTYTLAINEIEADRVLYLAVPDEVYEVFFQKIFIQKLVAHYGLKLLVFNIADKTIVQWKE